MTGIGGQGYPLHRAGGMLGNTQENQGFLDNWASRSAIWGTRHGVGEALDRYMGLHPPAFSLGFSGQLADAGIDDVEGKPTGPLTYQHILKLNHDHIAWKDLSWKSLKNTVTKNIEPLKNHIRYASAKDFFQDLTGRAYARDILWRGNIEPFKALFNGSAQNLFTNLGYTVGAGLMGATIAKTGVQHYHYWKQQEDGSFSSQMRTIYETGKAIGEKTIQSLGSWEAAGVGMAIGRALLPIGAIPFGGILVGSLFATMVYKVIGKVFPSLSRSDSSEN